MATNRINSGVSYGASSNTGVFNSASSPQGMMGPQFDLQVFQFRPRFRVRWWNGSVYADITPDVKQINTHKSLTEPAGQFTIQLVDRPRVINRVKNLWSKHIQAMDFMQIDMWNEGSPYVYTMRGFAENPQRIFNISGTTGGPSRYVQVNGHDMGLLLQKNQVRYLWQLDPAAQVANQFMLSSNYGIGLQLTKPADFVRDVMSKVINGQMIPNARQRISSIPTFKLASDMSSQYSVNSFQVQNFTGPFWNLLSYYADPVFSELFYIDTTDGPSYYYREPPYKSYGGTALSVFSPTRALIPDVLINLGIKKDHALGTSANEMDCFFFVYSDVASTNSGGGFNYIPYVGGAASNAMTSSGGQITTSIGVSGDSNPIYDKNLEYRFGFSDMSVSSPLISDPTLSTSASQKLAMNMARWMYNANRENYLFESGTITTHGDGSLQIGQHAIIGQWQEEFYVESVDMQMVAGNPSDGNTWTANLGVTRGRFLSDAEMSSLPKTNQAFTVLNHPGAVVPS